MISVLGRNWIESGIDPMLYPRFVASFALSPRERSLRSLLDRFDP